MSFADIAKMTDKSAEMLGFSEQERNRIMNSMQSISLPDLKESGDLNRQLNSLMHKETNLKCHAATLIEYLKVKRIQRGLRVPMSPILCKDDPVYKKEWYMILNKCSMDLMTLTVRHLQQAIQQVQQQIGFTEKELKQAAGDLENEMSALRAEIAQYEQELMQTKIRKFKRDTQDYANDLVYAWKFQRRDHRGDRGRFENSRRRQPHGASPTSSVSGEVSSQSDVHFLSSTPTTSVEPGGSGGARGGRGTVYQKIRSSQRRQTKR
ncbi:hypothetical protein XELAEV_18045166mg [Xenopus laevis]|uniref:Uncharacterized protein n=1 Tax=Xenopus laevis TaxID=8355 RepID=A0A974BZZ0_XENLA|nr:hypothetical protein XELAEV_18045166mg [Xenopus laevis]